MVIFSLLDPAARNASDKKRQTKQLKIEVINNGDDFMVSWNFKVDAALKSF